MLARVTRTAAMAEEVNAQIRVKALLLIRVCKYTPAAARAASCRASPLRRAPFLSLAPPFARR